MARISKKLGLAIGGCLIASALAVTALPQPPAAQTDGKPATPADRTTMTTAPQTDALPQEEPTGIRYPLTDLEVADAQFPLLLQNGDLRLDIPFSFDGINPDADGTEARNIAACTLTNLSGRHLEEAELILVTRDGSHIRFCAQQIPHHAKVLLFCTDTLELPPQDQWDQLYYRATYSAASSMLGGSLEAIVSGTRIQLTNTTDAPIPPFVLYCHDLLGEEYFGGKAYAYHVNTIPVGETVTIDATDSIIGMVGAVYASEITE